MNKLFLGNCLDVLPTLPDNSVDSIVTDPPAGISFMLKGWDSDKGGRDNWIEWMSNIAKECLRVLKPGGHAFVWALPRTTHWTATAWENGGFEPRDVVAHVFGSGFPKSHNIEKAVQKIQPERSNEFKGIGTALKPAREDWWLMRKPLDKGLTIAENCLKYGTGGINIDESRVGTDGGTRKGGEIKRNIDPSSMDLGIGTVEDIGMGRFPANLCWSCDCENNYLTGNALFDILSNISNQIKLCQLNNSNSNALNVEQKKHQQDTTSEEKKLCFAVENVDTLFLEKILGKTLEVIFSEDTECSAEMLEESMNTSLSISLSGNEKMEEYQKVLKFITLTATRLITELKTCNLSQSQIIGNFITKVISGIREQSRVKSHSQDCWVRECFPETKSGNLLPGHKRGDGTGNSLMGGGGIVEGTYGGDSGNASRFFKSILYYPKASKSERNKGCDELEEKQYSHDGREKEIENPYQRNKSVATNNHPTVKPVALMEYLIKMVTPKGGVVLDPFAGSGSTLVAAKENGFGFIGIELTPEYIPIIEARVGVKAETIHS